MKEQLQAIQEELKSLRDSVIPKINKYIKDISVDLAAANGKLNQIDKRFDDVLKRQERNAEFQTSRFDKLDEFMGTVMKTLGIRMKTSSHTHQGRNQTTTKSQKSSDRSLLLRH